MKTIKTQVVISRITAKRDSSVSFGASTPELTDEEKTEFFKLQNQVLEAILKPIDMVDAPELEINKDLEQKTPSQRTRNVLYVWWQHLGSQGFFDNFYRAEVEKYIESIKAKIQ